MDRAAGVDGPAGAAASGSRVGAGDPAVRGQGQQAAAGGLPVEAAGEGEAADVGFHLVDADALEVEQAQGVQDPSLRQARP